LQGRGQISKMTKFNFLVPVQSLRLYSKHGSVAWLALHARRGAHPNLDCQSIISIECFTHLFDGMLCGSLPALRPLVVSLMPKAYSKVRDKTCRDILSMRQSSVRGSVKSSIMEPEQQGSMCPAQVHQRSNLVPQMMVELKSLELLI
jgi:hypothetical protein